MNPKSIPKQNYLALALLKASPSSLNIIHKNKLFTFVPAERLPNAGVQTLHNHDLKKTGTQTENFLEALCKLFDAFWNFLPWNIKLFFEVIVDRLFCRFAQRRQCFVNDLKQELIEGFPSQPLIPRGSRKFGFLCYKSLL